MNTPNNKRKKESQHRIQQAFIQLIQTRELTQVTVSDICKIAQVNRTTFYNNYLDIYDLADKIIAQLRQDVLNLYPEERSSRQHSYNFLKLFYHIKENPIFYKTYFKLHSDNDPQMLEGFVDSEHFRQMYADETELQYHIVFFMSGLNAVLKRWLQGGCKESPEQIEKILKDEYSVMRKFL